MIKYHIFDIRWRWVSHLFRNAVSAAFLFYYFYHFVLRIMSSKYLLSSYLLSEPQRQILQRSSTHYLWYCCEFMRDRIV